MKTAAIAISILISSSAAFAADLATKPIEPTAPLSAFSWTGFYVGAQAGYTWTTSKLNLIQPGHNVSPWATADLDTKGALLGAYGGYNYQFGNNIVLGFDADADWTDAKTNSPGLLVHNVPGGSYFPTDHLATDLKWTGAARIRVGYALGRFLPYVAGGVAIAKLDNLANLTYFSQQTNRNYIGWTVGAGLEYMLTEHLTVRAEYRYSDYGNYAPSHLTTGVPKVAPPWATHQKLKYDLKTNDIRVGIAYKF